MSVSSARINPLFKICNPESVSIGSLISPIFDYKTYSFGGKVKDIARDLFKMEGKDRSLLINVASKMREIDPDVWAKYVINEIESNCKSNCIIDDLRFQNEADYLKGWTFISLITPKDVRIKRITELYPENYKDHIKNMNHTSERGKLTAPLVLVSP